MEYNVGKALEAEKNFGAEKRKKLRRIQFILMIAMAVLMIIFIINVNLIQGNAKVINYAGIVRGGTQQLVKEELYGEQDDRMISKMDDMLFSLRTGNGRYKGAKLSDRKYQKALSEQTAKWDKLKAEIIAYRADDSNKAQLFRMSQNYFRFADHTVTLAQDFSESIESRIKLMEWMIIALISMDALVVVMYGIELGKATRHNMKLNDIAYSDPCTGLSNKRKCEERLSDPEPIPDTSLITCFMFDINYLKKLNDEYGHEAGDRLIAEFGEALRQEAIPHMFIGRYGGDEFMAVAVDAGMEEIHSFSERLRENCRHRRIAGLDEISFAGGYATSDEFPGISISELMKKADQRMYDNKKSMKDVGKA